jgi:hypothetical protein
LLSLGEKLWRINPPESLAVATEALALAERLHDERSMAESLRLLGEGNMLLANYTVSEEQFDRAHALFATIGDDTAVAITTARIGDHLKRGEHEQALQCFVRRNDC